MWVLEKVSKYYKRNSHEIAALVDVNLQINEGEYLSIIGPSGSGKSSLLFVLGGMLVASQGRYLFRGQSLFDLTPSQRAHIRRDIGFVFQNFHLVPYLSARENVQVPLMLKESAAKHRAEELLDRVGLGDRMDHKPSELSAGQQQRVALARMMASDPQIILADEPTGNLDAQMTQEIIHCLEALNREGKAIVIVTHDMTLARRAKRMITIEMGSIKE